MEPLQMNKRIGFIVLSFVLALALHGWAIYYFHFIELDFYSLKKASVENQQPVRVPDLKELEEEKNSQRQEELSKVFNRLKPTIHENLELNLKEFTADAEPEEVDHVAREEVADSFSDDELPENDEELMFFLQNEAISYVEESKETVDELVKELVALSDATAGLVIDESATEEFADNAIKAGVEEASYSRIENVRIDSKFGRLDLSDFALSMQGEMKNQSSGFSLLQNKGLKEHRGVERLASKDTFHARVEFVPQETSSGFLFRVILLPKQGIRFKSIKQNYFFLVDRSHSIRPLRYELTKAAVSRALDFVEESDTFNILVFDDRVLSLSPVSLAGTEENIARARAFILGQKYAGAFATTDLYSSLGKILPKEVPEKEVNTVILLSDGDTFLSRDKQRETIGRWTAQNDGKVSLYCVPSGGGNNLPLLGLLSVLNKGSLVHAKKDREITDTLMTLMYNIHSPIGKELTAKAIVDSAKTVVELYPSSRRLSNLYENASYVVYGNTNKLDNFHLFLQGRYYDDSLDIKIDVNFDRAIPISDGSIEMELAQQRAYVCYENYLRDGRRSHLNLAKKLLSPYRTVVPFQ